MERGFSWPDMENCLNLEHGFFRAAYDAFDNAVVALEKERDELNAPAPEADPSSDDAPYNEPPHVMESRINEMIDKTNRHAADTDKIALRQWERMDALENKVATRNNALGVAQENVLMLTKAVDTLTDKVADLERKAEPSRQAIQHGPEYKGRR